MGHNFTTEELRVLRECNSESFWYRSLPIGSALGVGTWLAIQRGVIGGSAKWGSYPKVKINLTSYNQLIKTIQFPGCIILCHWLFHWKILLPTKVC